MGRAIFISYRRDDSEGEAGRLYDDLVRTYGDDSVFLDVAGINPGIDFRRAIDDNVATCGVLLAMIGPTWATIADENGHRRLENENDFVRLEIASALRREIPVIPVLVHEAKMPRPDQLPEDLKNLAYRNSVEITHARWNSDVQLLTAALAQYVKATSATSNEPIHANVPVQLPAPNAPQPSPVLPKKSKTPLIAGVAVVVVLAAIAAVFFGVHRPQPAPPAPVSGTWTNPTPDGNNGLQKLQVAAQGNQLSLHAWGQCQPADCDWGTQSAVFDGQKATATWNIESKDGKEDNRAATVTIAAANGALHVTVVNSYRKRKPNEHQFDFVKAQ